MFPGVRRAAGLGAVCVLVNGCSLGVQGKEPPAQEGDPLTAEPEAGTISGTGNERRLSTSAPRHAHGRGPCRTSCIRRGRARRPPPRPHGPERVHQRHRSVRRRAVGMVARGLRARADRGMPRRLQRCPEPGPVRRSQRRGRVHMRRLHRDAPAELRERAGPRALRHRLLRHVRHRGEPPRRSATRRPARAPRTSTRASTRRTTPSTPHPRRAAECARHPASRTAPS